jgi:hypothetical protein
MLDNQVVKGVTGPSNGGPCKTPELAMTRLVALAKKKFPEVPQEFWDGLGVSDTDNVTIIIRP